MNIIKTMEEYNITLRKLPEKVYSCYRIPNNPTKEELKNVTERVVKYDITEEEFNKWRERGYYKNNYRWENNKVFCKFVESVRILGGGWMAKQDSRGNGIQQWNKKYDGYGKTAEEAITDLIEKISKNEKKDELNNKRNE